MALADLVEEIKKSSSKWIKTKGVFYQNFYWQDGYGGFSVSNSGVDHVKEYISNQKQHHYKTSNMEEYKTLLDAYNIQYEEKYL
jgi:REP-associated tyrosine transposase